MNDWVKAEIASQPTCWRVASAAAADAARVLPVRGERVAVMGCGTSWYMAMAYARLRESSGHGVTDAFAASEMPVDREYDRVVAISRSGTTTEVIVALATCRAPSVVLTAVATSPVTSVADETVCLDFAEEESVVQTRYATSALALLRAHLGHVIEPVAIDAERALEAPVGELVDIDQVTFLGHGWTVGLAHEAALKVRESAQFWSESYPAMEYRHGPIAIATARRLVWMFGSVPDGLSAAVEATGARLLTCGLDPMADLVRAQRLAVELADRQGLDADRPRHLTRSVILDRAVR